MGHHVDKEGSVKRRGWIHERLRPVRRSSSCLEDLRHKLEAAPLKSLGCCCCICSNDFLPHTPGRAAHERLRAPSVSLSESPTKNRHGKKEKTVGGQTAQTWAQTRNDSGGGQVSSHLTVPSSAPRCRRPR